MPTSALTRLPFKPISPETLNRIQTVFTSQTLPKIVTDTKRNARNVARARSQVAFR